jgi:hypothetical protein
MDALWTKGTTTKFQDDPYHDNPSFSPSPDVEELLDRKKETFNLHDAKSAAWKTLATILPRAARLPALGSLLQNNMFVEPTRYSFFSKEQRDATSASLKYLEVKLFA